MNFASTIIATAERVWLPDVIVRAAIHRLCEKEWRWSATHYQRTAQHWLENFDTHRAEIERVLHKVCGCWTAL
jgi:cyclopropane fatty-acyl-phospholipid synthase-like methyltransferase